MARLTAAQRRALPDSAFAGPGRSYPVNDPSHARNALARVSQFGSPTEKQAVRRRVAKRYPSIGSQMVGQLQQAARHKRRHKVGR